jgi:hypothetical protein
MFGFIVLMFSAQLMNCLKTRINRQIWKPVEIGMKCKEENTYLAVSIFRGVENLYCGLVRLDVMYCGMVTAYQPTRSVTI